MADTLFSPPRKAPKKKDFTPYSTAQLHSPFPNLPDCTETGALNFFGAIKQLLLPLQNQRKWHVSTCHNASRLLANYLYDKFSGVPFSSILEEDLLSLLEQFDKESIPPSTKQRLKFLIRAIFQLAFDLGLTSTILWGIPEWSLPEEDPFTSEKEYATAKDEFLTTSQKRKLDQLFGTGRSISPAVELVLLIDMLCLAQGQGELIAGLIIWICGARPAEACNLKYKHFRQISENVWSFTRSDIGDTVAGKTTNASRHLILPYFLTCFIKSRIEYLRFLGYTQEQINEMYVACPGQDYSTTHAVSTTELNRKLKAVYYRAGVAEDMMAHAYTAIAENKDVREHCDGSSSAYLGRHQASTEFYGVGLPLNDSALNIGHAKIGGLRQKSDFARADVASEFYKRQHYRPVIFILDTAFESATGNDLLFERGGVNRIELDKHLASLKLSATNHIQFSEITSSIHSDLPVSISFDKDATFSFSVVPDTPNDTLSFSPLNIDGLTVLKSRLPISRSTSEYTSTQKAMVHMAVSALAEYKQKHLKNAVKSEIISADTTETTTSCSPISHSADTPLPLESELPHDTNALAATNSVKQPAQSIPPINLLTPYPAISTLEPEPDVSNFPCIEDAPIPLVEDVGSEEKLAFSPIASPSPKEYNRKALYLVTSRGLLPVTPDSVQIRPISRNGTKLPSLRSNTTVYGILSHDPALPMYVISADSTTFKLPPCPNLLEYIKDHVHSPACEALLTGGITLQSALLNNLNCNIFCLAQDGSFRIISASALARIERSASVQLFSLTVDQRIVDAFCLSGIEESILLAASNGDALRIGASVLHAVKTAGSMLVHGMILEQNSSAIACIPIDREDLLAVSTDGWAQQISIDAIPCKAPARKSTQLMRCTSLSGITTISKNIPVLLCTSAGYLHCIHLSSVPQVTSSAVQAITFRAGTTAHVVGLCPYDLLKLQKDTVE